jgi:hypothetical protein
VLFAQEEHVTRLVRCTLWSTGHYTCFCYPHFCIFMVLFQYHEEHQYPIHSHGRSCCAGLPSCARSFTDLLHHFDSGNYKLRPLMVYHSENSWAYHIYPVLCIFYIHGNSQEHNPPRITRVTCTLKFQRCSLHDITSNDVSRASNWITKAIMASNVTVTTMWIGYFCKNVNCRHCCNVKCIHCCNNTMTDRHWLVLSCSLFTLKCNKEHLKRMTERNVHKNNR